MRLMLGGAAALTATIVTLSFAYWSINRDGHSVSPISSDVDTSQTLASDSMLGADLLTAAETGDIEAQFRLGQSKLIEAAIDAAKGTEAVHWLLQAAEGGHSGAMTRLGLMYQKGTGVLQNYDLAVNWISQAAHKGDPAGMLEYGRLYRDGIGVDKDMIQAYVWLNRAAAANNLTAMREREAVSLTLSKDELRLAQNLSMEPYRNKPRDSSQTGIRPQEAPSHDTNGLASSATRIVLYPTNTGYPS